MMLRKYKEMLKNKAGFTLIELLIVIAILGVIAALAIPRIAESMKESRSNTCKRTQKMIRNQLEVYKQKVMSAYPSSQANFDILMTDRAWFERAPDCPNTANNYAYTYTSGPVEDFGISCPDTKADGHNTW